MHVIKWVLLAVVWLGTVVCAIPCHASERIDSTYRIFQLRGSDTASRLGKTINCLGDINNDGCDDIAITSIIPDGTSIYFGGSPPDTIADMFLQGYLGPPTAIDLTGDGINEILITDMFKVGYEYSGVIYFYRGYEDSVGSVPYDSLRPEPDNWAFGGRLRCAYVDSDSLGDLLTSTTSMKPGGATVFYYSGCPTLDTVADWTFQIEDGSHTVSSLDFIDFDGDSQLDIFLALSGQYRSDFSYVYVFLGPDFGATPDHIIGYPVEIYSWIDSTLFARGGSNIGDFDGDGWDDLGVLYGDIALVYKCGPSADTVYDYELVGKAHRLASIGDINADGSNDLGTYSGDHGQYSGVDVYFGGAAFDLSVDGYITRSVLPPWYLNDIGWRISTAGDFNCDGIDDFMFSCNNFVANAPSGAVFVYRGDPQIPTDILYDYEPSLPDGYRLSHNFPNPFNPTTTIEFDIPKRSQISLSIYNVLGQEVVTLINQDLSRGTYTVTWNGRDQSGEAVASGIYIYKLSSDTFEESRKMVLLK